MSVRELAQTTKQEIKREIVEFVKLVAWFLVLFVALKAYVVEGYEVQGPSMIPTLRDEERILVFKLPHFLSQLPLLSGMEAIKPNDIVVFDSPDGSGKRYVKRVIAKGPPRSSGNKVGAAKHDPDSKEGVVVFVDHGTVYVNNRKIDESYIADSVKAADESSDSEHILGPGAYYVLGDNRTISKDSRSFGSISDDRVIGKAVLRFWPLHKFSLIR